jgi:5-methylcytosine-specific restriction endonuclease McrA
MAKHKIRTTIQWEVEVPEGREFNATKLARETLIKVLPAEFKMQILKAGIPGRKKVSLETLGEFTLHEIFSQLNQENTRIPFAVGDNIYQVRMNSHRYFVFHQNSCCVSCGLQGSKFLLQQNPCDESPHFNLYGEENGELVLMTKDHILPKSKGGKNNHDNYVTMCTICNNLKADFQITPDQVAALRVLKKQNAHLTKKQLSKLIAHTREFMSKTPVSQ